MVNCRSYRPLILSISRCCNTSAFVYRYGRKYVSPTNIIAIKIAGPHACRSIGCVSDFLFVLCTEGCIPHSQQITLVHAAYMRVVQHACVQDRRNANAAHCRQPCRTLHGQHHAKTLCCSKALKPSVELRVEEYVGRRAPKRLCPLYKTWALQEIRLHCKHLLYELE